MEIVTISCIAVGVLVLIVIVFIVIRTAKFAYDIGNEVADLDAKVHHLKHVWPTRLKHEVSDLRCTIGAIKTQSEASLKKNRADHDVFLREIKETRKRLGETQNTVNKTGKVWGDAKQGIVDAKKMFNESKYSASALKNDVAGLTNTHNQLRGDLRNEAKSRDTLRTELTRLTFDLKTMDANVSRLMSGATPNSRPNK